MKRLHELLLPTTLKFVDFQLKLNRKLRQDRLNWSEKMSQTDRELAGVDYLVFCCTLGVPQQMNLTSVATKLIQYTLSTSGVCVSLLTDGPEVRTTRAL